MYEARKPLSIMTEVWNDIARGGYERIFVSIKL